MKNRNHKLAGACAALTATLALPAAAADAHTGLYFNAEAGPNWSQDLNVRIGGASGKASTDVGARFGASVGYQLHQYIGVEFDTGWVWNQFKGSDDSLSHIPFLGNVVFRYPNSSKFEPYVGVGAGGSYSILSIDRADETDGDLAFAWQALAGVRYNFNHRMSLGLGYKYLNVSKTDFDISGTGVHLARSENHAVSVVFQMKF